MFFCIIFNTVVVIPVAVVACSDCLAYCFLSYRSFTVRSCTSADVQGVKQLVSRLDGADTILK